MSVTNPTAFTESNIIAAATLARGSTSRGTLDLTAKFGAYILARIGRGGTTAITDPVQLQVRRVYGGASGITIHPNANQSRASGTTTTNGNSTVNVDAAIAASEIKLVSVTGFAAGDLVCIQDSGGGVTRLEWARVSKATVASGTGLTLDAPLQYAHTSVQADTVRNQADVFSAIWCPGGALWEVVVDYGKASTGDTVTIQVVAQTYASDTTA